MGGLILSIGLTLYVGRFNNSFMVEEHQVFVVAFIRGLGRVTDSVNSIGR